MSIRFAGNPSNPTGRGHPADQESGPRPGQTFSEQGHEPAGRKGRRPGSRPSQEHQRSLP